VPVPGAGGTFIALTDTPSSYSGRGGHVVLVKTTEDGIETQPWPVTGTTLNFFLSDDAADIGSYYYMYPTESGDGYSELTSPSLSAGDDQLLWSFVTEAGEPGIDQLALGAYTATLFLEKTGNKDVRVYWKLFKRDTGGTETEILQSAVSDYLTTDNSQYLISAYLNEDQTLDPTDRLVLKLFANVSGTGSDVTVTLTMEGDYDSRLTINILSSAFNLDRLSDVTITSPSNDELLAYDSGSGKWINQTPSEAGILAADGSVPLTGDLDANGHSINNLSSQEIIHGWRTQQLTNNARYASWPMGKAFVYENVIYVLFNEGSGHTSSDLGVYMLTSKDGGKTWLRSTVYENPDPEKWDRGVTCWGAGVDSNGDFWAIVRRRDSAGYGLDTNTDHILLKSSDRGASWEVQGVVDVDDGSDVPIEFTSFAELGDGSLAWGYHFPSGEFGVAKTSDGGLSWSRTAIDTNSALAEVSLFYDADNGRTIGFARSSDLSIAKPLLWYSDDNCVSFTKITTDIEVEASFIPIVESPNGEYYYALACERLSPDQWAAILLLWAKKSEATVWDNWRSQVIGYIPCPVSGSSGTGEPDGCVCGGSVFWFLGGGDPSTPDIYLIAHEDVHAGTIEIGAHQTIKPLAKAYISDGAGNQAIETDVKTVVMFDSTAFDPTLQFDTTNSKFIVNEPGYYLVHASVLWTSSATGTLHQLYIRRNGSDIRTAKIYSYGTNAFSQETFVIEFFQRGDEIDVRVYQASGSTLYLNSGEKLSFVEIIKVG